jgi:hypothetical protein
MKAKMRLMELEMEGNIVEELQWQLDELKEEIEDLEGNSARTLVEINRTVELLTVTTDGVVGAKKFLNEDKYVEFLRKIDACCIAMTNILMPNIIEGGR